MTTGTYVTAQGLDIPSVDDIITECANEQRSEINPLLNTDADSPVGQLNGIFASHIRRVYEIASIAYNGNNPDAAEGFLLESISAITGTIKAPATPSKLIGVRSVRVTLSVNTTVPAGTEFHVAGDPNTSFHTLADVSSVAAGDYLVECACDVTGPVTCNAGTLTAISTPVVGLNAVTNDFDAIPGTNQDTDTQLRVRREQELRATGSGTVDSVRADILAIALADGSKPVVECVILENVTDAADSNGLPGHSLECIVFDGVDQNCPNDTIAQTIWESKPGGIKLVGSSSGTAIDSLGNNRTVSFTRPTVKEVFLNAALLLIDPNKTPDQYLAAVRAAVIAMFAVKVRSGFVIRCNHYIEAILGIPGIDDAAVSLGFNPPGTLSAPGVNLTLGVREDAFIQTTGITVS